MATTFTWLGGGGNSFDTPSDWNPGGPPAAGDTIIMPSGLSMVIGNGTLADTVFNAGSNDTLSLNAELVTGGSLAATGNLTLDATGSTLENIAVSIGNGGAVDLGGSLNAGGGVAVSGTLVIGNTAGSSGSLAISGGGTVSVQAGGPGAFAGVVLGNAASAGPLAAAAGSLTIGGGSGVALLDDAGDLLDGAFGAGAAVVAAGGTVIIGGTLALGNTNLLNPGVGSMQVNGGLVTAAAVQVSPGSTLSAGAGTGIVAIGGVSVVQGIAVAPGATLFGAGIVSGNLADNGAVLADVPLGTLQLGGGSITGSGSLVVGSASTLDILAFVHYGNPVVFNGVAGVLRLEAPAALQGGISGFGVGDVIDLPGVTFVVGQTLSYDGAAGALHFGADIFQVGTGYFAGNFALHAEGGGGKGTEIAFVACFAAGTRVLTARGAVAVEALHVGDALATGSGRLRRLRWIGRTRTARVAPIRIAAGAFGRDQPHAALLLSPDHAVFAGGALIPAHLLVNGGSIRREPTDGTVAYFHLELDRHAVVLAEGLPAESYLDTGNRAMLASEEGEELRPGRRLPSWTGR